MYDLACIFGGLARLLCTVDCTGCPLQGVCLCYLCQVLVSAPVEMVWESTFVEVRPYGTSMSLGLLQLLDADCAARAEEGARDAMEEGGTTKGTPKGTPKVYTEAEGDFDWVFCMGNFTLTLTLTLTLTPTLTPTLTLTLTLTR
jgi:hypothetical protein